MESDGLGLTLVIITFLTATASTQVHNEVCKACNCQLSNVQALSQLIDAKIADKIGPIGVTYVRWGRTSCPNVAGTQLVYVGRAGGTKWNIQGGGAEKLCLPSDPDYLDGTTGLDTTIPASPHVHGAEYEYLAGPLRGVSQHNVLCAVCYASTRASTLMIPAKTECPSTWTREYYGYLSSERAHQPDRDNTQSSGHFRSSFNCVDANPETIPGSSAHNTAAAEFYHVLSACDTNGLECPPYEQGRALSCVVCTK